MTNTCTCKAEHWQPHADSCPAKQNKRSVIREYVSFQAQLEGVAAMGSAASHLVLQSLVAQAARVVERLVLDKEQLRGNLSLAEEGLANYAQEVERKNSLIDAQDAAQTSLHAENVRLRVETERLRAALTMLIREAQNVADDHHHPRYTRLDQALESARKMEGTSHEPSELPAVCKGPPPGCPYIYCHSNLVCQYAVKSGEVLAGFFRCGFCQAVAPMNQHTCGDQYTRDAQRTNV